MNSKVGIGIIGCGNISAAYLRDAKAFSILNIRALADANPAAAQARAEEFGIPAISVEALLADASIEIVVNLTTPKAHVPVGLRAVAAAKHIYSEKPLGIGTVEAREFLHAAEARGGLRVGCAPATFLGGAHQTCRRLIDEGAIGTPLGGTAFFLCPGHERWHPAPAFYYLEGGGPMLDMGPYYITALVNLLGPVTRVAGMATRLRDTRIVNSEPLRGSVIPVEVATHVAGTVQFCSGAVVSLIMSFDVAKHRHSPIEIYGTEGSLMVPDPDSFGGEIELAKLGREWTTVATDGAYADGNYRIIGVADMAHAMREKRAHRASGALAFHVLEVMEAFGRSSESGRFVKIKSRPSRPEPLRVDELR